MKTKHVLLITLLALLCALNWGFLVLSILALLFFLFIK